jgi:ornithine cyclodeaminase/alanine dehydrogenase-like protein (mu-crystallin family)
MAAGLPWRFSAQSVPIDSFSEQASHNGDIGRAVEAGRLRREDVAELGRVLLGEEEGRRSDDEITVFDSTGLAVQDLAVAIAVYESWRAEPDADVFADVVDVQPG